MKIVHNECSSREKKPDLLFFSRSSSAIINYDELVEFCGTVVFCKAAAPILSIDRSRYSWWAY